MTAQTIHAPFPPVPAVIREANTAEGPQSATPAPEGPATAPMAKHLGASHGERVTVRAAESMRQAGVYRPFLLATLTMAEADERGVWATPSKAAVRRRLTRPNDAYGCTEAELKTALHFAVNMGLLAEGSTARELVLPGAEVQE